MSIARPDRSEFTGAAIGVVALCFTLNTLARGLGETFAVFYGSFLDEFGWSRTEVSAICSVFMIGIGIGIGIGGPCIGMTFDRLGGGRSIWAGCWPMGWASWLPAGWRHCGKVIWAWGCWWESVRRQPA